MHLVITQINQKRNPMEDYRKLAIDAIVELRMEAMRPKNHIEKIDRIIHAKITRKDTK